MFEDLFFNSFEDFFYTNKICPKCKLDFITYKKTGRLGCEKCYETFKEELYQTIKNYHIETQHIGKCPSKYIGKSEAKLRNLNLKLKKAIGCEDYEEAARLRDLIREISGK